LRPGDPSKHILEEARSGHYDLVLVARRLSRRPPRLRMRSTTQQLAQHIPAHLLVTRNVPAKLNRILICSGAERPSAETVRLAG
ncbi:MAG: universal stress protein, partial [Anaerolineae bacterium]|nr:universal stress protein [Anaerolineae bacterium]